MHDSHYVLQKYRTFKLQNQASLTSETYKLETLGRKQPFQLDSVFMNILLSNEILFA